MAFTVDTNKKWDIKHKFYFYAINFVNKQNNYKMAREAMSEVHYSFVLT